MGVIKMQPKCIECGSYFESNEENLNYDNAFCCDDCYDKYCKEHGED